MGEASSSFGLDSFSNFLFQLWANPILCSYGDHLIAYFYVGEHSRVANPLAILTAIFYTDKGACFTSGRTANDRIQPLLWSLHDRWSARDAIPGYPDGTDRGAIGTARVRFIMC